MRPSRTAALLATLSLGNYACGDPLKPLAIPNQPDAGKGATAATSAFTCTFSRQDPDDPAYYHYGWIRFHIPKKDLAPNGAMVSYRVYFQNRGEKPGAVYNCRLPNSPAVLAYMNERVERLSSGAAPSTGSVPPAESSVSVNVAPPVALSMSDLPVIVSL